MSKEPFATKLARARRAQGLTQTEVGNWVGSVKGTISRWETGAKRPSRTVVEILDRRLGFQGELLRQWQVEETGSEIPHWKQHIPWLQKNSHTIDTASSRVVHGLLQSESYRRFVFSELCYSGSDIELESEIQERDKLFSWVDRGEGPWIVSVISISALTGVPPDVRREQARKLLHLIENARVSVHLIPEHTLVLTGVLNIYHLRGGGVGASSEYDGGFVVHRDEALISRLSAVFRHSLGSALPKAESKRKLEEMA